jgi:hypothetical protein
MMEAAAKIFPLSGFRFRSYLRSFCAWILCATVYRMPIKCYKFYILILQESVVERVKQTNSYINEYRVNISLSSGHATSAWSALRRYQRQQREESPKVAGHHGQPRPRGRYCDSKTSRPCLSELEERTGDCKCCSDFLTTGDGSVDAAGIR